MRRFKLLQDLPGFLAGTIFYTKDDEDSDKKHLYIKSIDKPSGYSVYGTVIITDTGIGIDAIKNWLKELPEEKKRWRADRNETYYYIESFGDVNGDEEEGARIDTDRYNIGNYFKTREEAQAVADYLKALATVRDDAKGFKPDWSKSDEQSRWIVAFAHKILPPRPEVIGDWNLDRQFNSVFGLPYFRTENDAKESIEKHKAEWLTVFGVEDETDSDDE